MLRKLLVCLLLPLLAACGAEPTWAPDDAVRQARFSTGEPPSITLFTVIGIPRGEGGHSALMIDASQRVMFDPAGTWRHPNVPERNDVHYGITPMMKAFYIDYHARETYYVEEQKVLVSPEVAELAMRRAEEYGAVSKAMCANATSTVLRGLPGFETIPVSFYPLRIRDAFGKLPGVQTKIHKDGDPANNHNVLLVQQGKVLNR
ncbi:hypothetical protein ACEYYB_08590 [Paracoccus sp. p4-l81]|uniref:hypothetical protein n=1 Tax=unclassified Paracoccus (in: a-proteobacteria) TaxID=2688777 RepID=UPI0035B8E582